MKRKTIKINAQCERLLWEAMRRALYTGSRKTLDNKFLGLGYPSEYKEGRKYGLFIPSFGATIPRILSWYKLTPLGQKIVKQLIRKKICPESSEDGFCYPQTKQIPHILYIMEEN